MQEPITHISCDGCEESQEETFGTAKEVRKALKERGWVNYGALDYCPNCKATEQAKARKSIFTIESTN